MSHLVVGLQVFGIALLIVWLLILFILAYALIGAAIRDRREDHRIKKHNERLAEEFFPSIERYRDDFA